MTNIAHDLITSNFDEKYVNQFLQSQKENPQKTEIEALSNALELMSVNLMDKNYSIDTLNSELKKIGKLVSLFTDAGFQYAVEHTKNYLSEFNEYSFSNKNQNNNSLILENKIFENFISNKFKRELRNDIRECIAFNFSNEKTSNEKTNNKEPFNKRIHDLIVIVTDFYVFSKNDDIKNIFKNIESYYYFAETNLEKSNKPKM